MPDTERATAYTCEPDPLPYDYLKAPGDFSIPFQHGSSRPDNHARISQVGTFYVKCKDVLRIGLPLDPDDARAANPRAPDNNAAVVTDMRDTLIAEPSIFHVKNGGITIVCESFEIEPCEEIPDSVNEWLDNSDKVSLSWLDADLNVSIIEGDGIINGGHSYYSIMSMDEIDDSALVRLEFIQLEHGLGEAERRNIISELAIARNKNRQLSDNSSANYLGYYNKWKDILPEHIKTGIIWKEGDPDSANIIDAEVELIPLLWGMEYTQENYHPEYTPEGSTTSSFKKALFKKWYTDVAPGNDPLDHMLPLLLMILKLREHVSSSIHGIIGNLDGRNLHHPIAARCGPNSPVQEQLRFRGTRFSNWLLRGNVGGRGGVNRNTSIFNREDYNSIPSTFRDILMANFRSVFWYKADLNTDKKVTGVVVNPFTLWNELRDKIMGAFMHEFNTNSRSDPKEFIRNENVKFVNFLTWASIDFDYGTDYPEILAYEGRLFEKTEDDENCELWVKNEPNNADFVVVSGTAIADSQKYQIFVQDYAEAPAGLEV